MNDVFNSILPLFLIVGLGILLKTIKLASNNWIKVLNNYAFFIGMPALILNSLISIKKIDYNIFTYNALILLLFSIIIVVSLKILKTKKELLNTYLICISFGNIAYLGFPFITSIISNSASIVSLIIASSSLVIFGIIVLYLEYTKKGEINLKLLKNIPKNPLLLAVFLGLLITTLNITVPKTITNAITMIGNSASPVALIALGMFLVKKISFGKELIHAMIITFIKLILMPIIFFIINKEMTIVIIESAMPVAISIFAMSQQYPMKKTIVVYSIMLSTILSIFTLPYIASFF